VPNPVRILDAQSKEYLKMTNDITFAELDVDLLPERQTMSIFGNINPVVAENGAEAVQALTLLSANLAIAPQNVNVIG
jgi:hypothetical protein